MAVLAKKASGGVKHKSTKEVENLKKKGGNKDKKIGKEAAVKNDTEDVKKAAAGVTDKDAKKKAEPKEQKKPNAGVKRKSTEDVDTLKKNTEGAKKGGKRKRGGKKHKEAEKRKLEERMILEGDLRKIYEERKNARDACCLFVVMKDYEEKVEFNKAVNARRKSKRTFFVDYSTPKQAKSMIKELEKREDVLVARSVAKPGEGADIIYVNPCQLFMENIPEQVELSDLKALFPTSSHIHYLSKKSFAKIYYTDGKSAEEAFRNADNVVLKGSKMTVLYTSFGKAPKKDSTKASPAKRQKVDPEVEQAEEEEEEEEEEEDDDDEEEEEDDDEDDE
ncbi:DNA ligase 1-like [Penaeus japonicus]|uniref:DNA ligase 1-like n=1 Tax=Penaeus japonicus TaxID=27405 RepID=UPI001C716976|nr:DNA ligase 1-like [Penaeus japonicus]